MWWLSQAKLKDVLNRWICSSFQPVSAQNIPHLDPRGSWKHFCGTPGDLNCTLLIYRTICKRYSSKKCPRWEKHPRFTAHNAWTRCGSLGALRALFAAEVGAWDLLQKPTHCYQAQYLTGQIAQPQLSEGWIRASNPSAGWGNGAEPQLALQVPNRVPDTGKRPGQQTQWFCTWEFVLCSS